MSGKYNEAYQKSITDPEAFWGEAAENIQWNKPCDKVLDDSRAPFYRWFRGGELNTCYNAVDYHCETGRGEQLAIIYDSPLTDTTQTFTYNELKYAVAHLVCAISDQCPE